MFYHDHREGRVRLYSTILTKLKAFCGHSSMDYQYLSRARFVFTHQ